MPEIIVRKCPFTGKYFERDGNYANHLKKLRIKKTASRKRRKTQKILWNLRQAAKDKVAAEIAALKTIGDIEQYVMTNFSAIMMAWNGGDRKEVHDAIERVKMEEFELRVRYYNNVSNTHSKPRDGVTNWGGRTEGAPRGYPGFSGHVTYKLLNDPEKDAACGYHVLRSSGALGSVGIHTGTGGGRGNQGQHEFGVNLYLSDFTGLRKQHFLNKLAGTVK